MTITVDNVQTPSDSLTVTVSSLLTSSTTGFLPTVFSYGNIPNYLVTTSVGYVATSQSLQPGFLDVISTTLSGTSASQYEV